MRVGGYACAMSSAVERTRGAQGVHGADSSLIELCALFDAARRCDESLVLATIVRTEGSTYRKAGAQVLFSTGGSTSGLLSGGCLEADLHERALRVIAQGTPERVVFDTREDADDPIFGLGAGCEGANEIWLQPATPANGYAPLPYMAACLGAARAGGVCTVIGGAATRDELGRHAYAGVESDDPLLRPLAAIPADRAKIERVRHDGRMLEVFVAPVLIPPALLICGGGPDARPLAQFAATLGWRVTVYDHRPMFTNPADFPASARVVLGRAGELLERLAAAHFDAAVIMSHHLPSDVEYLRNLSLSPPDFIGLLGPPARRARLFAEVGPSLKAVLDRIHGPVGLDIGARTPASIALSIVAEIQASLAGRHGAPLAIDHRHHRLAVPGA
jgi:xanthine/CO dehydrogenase XdhC/CoxF family maturation factor